MVRILVRLIHEVSLLGSRPDLTRTRNLAVAIATARPFVKRDYGWGAGLETLSYVASDASDWARRVARALPRDTWVEPVKFTEWVAAKDRSRKALSPQHG